MSISRSKQDIQLVKTEDVYLCEHLGFFGGVSIAHLLIICVGLFVLSSSFFVLPVSLDCPFLIAPSVFSNVYLPASLDRPFEGEIKNGQSRDTGK
jgi:hypothetical protein